MMKPALKYWIFLVAVITAIFAVILGSFAASWYSLSQEEKTLVGTVSHKLLPFPIVGAIILMMIIGTLVSLLFSYYIIPILKLAEEARLIATVNPAYRITPSRRQRGRLPHRGHQCLRRSLPETPARRR